MTSNTAHAAQTVIVRHGNAERLELPGATFGLLADGETTQGTLGANRLSLGTGADGAEPHYHARSWELFYVVDGTRRETSSWCHPGCPTRSAPPRARPPTCWSSSLRASNGSDTSAIFNGSP